MILKVWNKIIKRFVKYWICRFEVKAFCEKKFGDIFVNCAKLELYRLYIMYSFIAASSECQDLINVVI